MEPKGSITSMEAQWAALASNVRGQLRTAAGSATKTAWNPCPKGLAPQLLCLHSTRGCPCHRWQSKGRPHHTNNCASAFKWRLHAETPCSWDKLKLSKAPFRPSLWSLTGHPAQSSLPAWPEGTGCVCSLAALTDSCVLPWSCCWDFQVYFI